METSDSEYFESADEDFRSEDEDTRTVKSVEESDSKCEKTASKKLKKAKSTETEEVESEFVNLNINKNKDKADSDNLKKDDDSNVTSKVSKKENVRKLGQKVDSVKEGPESTPPEEEKKKLQPQGDEEICELTTHIDSSVKKPELEETQSEEEVKTQKDDKADELVASDSSAKESEKDAAREKSHSEENLWDDSEIDWGKEKDEENMWDNDDWEPVEPQPEEKVPSVNTSWSSWGNWGVSSIISTASQSVSTITQGISTVLETGMGVPEPEELARINTSEKEPGGNSEDKNTGFGLGNFVMGVTHLTKLVESTGTKVISGGLDTLETIGKKTMEVLQEGDPGLKKKRAFLKIDQDKPVLSQLLREAKEKAENENKILEQKHFARKAKNYETLFDDHQGLVHLEALEMLSKQCDIKLQTLLESYTDESLTEMQETMDQVKELSELPDEDEDEQANWSEILEKVNSAVSEINIPISYKKLIDTWEETETWLNNLKLEVCDARELHQQAVETLAQLTAIAVEQFHKAGELLLVKEHRSTADEADSLVQLTTSLTSLIGIVAAKFSDKLNAKSSNAKNKEEINGLITNVFFEAANSSSYIQDAFQLLIPVLQVGAV